LLDGKVPSPDGAWFDWLARIGFAAASLFLLATLVQFYYVWGEAKKILHTLARLPMAAAFDRLPEVLRTVWGGALFSTKPRHTHLTIAVHQLGRVRCYLATQLLTAKPDLAAKGNPHALIRVAQEAFSAKDEVSPEQLAERLAAELKAPADPSTGAAPVTPPKEVGLVLTEYSHKAAQALLPCWPAHSLEEAFDRHPDADARRQLLASFLAALPPEPPLREWVRLLEDFVAIEVVRYISQFFAHLRNLMVALTVGSLLLVLAATLYPFHPQALLLLYLMGLTGTVAVSMIVWLVQMNRDELISRIEQSEPNRFTPDLAFFRATATYVLPIVGVLLVQFPSIGAAVRNVIDPLLHIVH
jgi:hypothetical protein